MNSFVPSTSTLWNGLPPVITCLPTFNTFKNYLKTLCTLYKILNNTFSFPENIINFRSRFQTHPMPTRHVSANSLYTPYAHCKMETNSWYRFCMQVFVQIQVCQCLFGDAGPTLHSNIQAAGEPMWYTTLLVPKSSHFCRNSYK